MLSIVCPVYNEADNIQRLLDQVRDKLSVPLELIIVYDFEDDTTVPVVRANLDRYPFPIHLVKNRLGTGVLNAIKTGFLEANGVAILVVMADLSDDLSAVDEMYHLVTQRGVDIVCGSRYMRGGQQKGGPLIKRTLSRIAGVSLHVLAGLPTHDITNSFKVYRREFVAETKLESDGGFEIGMELVVKAFLGGRTIVEIPTIWSDRTAGQSRFRLWKWIPKYLRWYLHCLGVVWMRRLSAVRLGRLLAP
jgi:glycosyltransferase involved in cell wall biosynthesis